MPCSGLFPHRTLHLSLWTMIFRSFSAVSKKRYRELRHNRNQWTERDGFMVQQQDQWRCKNGSTAAGILAGCHAVDSWFEWELYCMAAFPWIIDETQQKSTMELSANMGNIIRQQNIEPQWPTRYAVFPAVLSLVPVSYTHWRCRRSTLCRSRWSPYH